MNSLLQRKAERDVLPVFHPSRGNEKFEDGCGMGAVD